MKKEFLASCLFVLLVCFTHPASAEDTALPNVGFRHIVYFYPDTDTIEPRLLPSIPAGFSYVEAITESTQSPVISFEFITDFSDDYPVPDHQYLAYSGRGLDKQQADAIQASNYALIIDAAFPLNQPYSRVKQVSEYVFAVAKQHNGLIWDSETRELFSLDAWQYRRIDSWEDGLPIAEKQTTIHAYQSNDGIRAITLGMAKFGQPDIVINSFAWSQNDSVVSLINLVSQSLLEGAMPDQNDELTLNIDKLQDTAYKRKLKASLLENAHKEVTIDIGDGLWEEGDPQNFLLELLFDQGEGKTLSEKQENLLGAMFGWQDGIVYVSHNDEILAASERAFKKLNGLKNDFNQGLAPGEFIQLKAPFEKSDGGNEWMWVEVLEWGDGQIKGLLQNEPFDVPDLKVGSHVTILQQDVFDYIRYFPDGTSEGNETGVLIRKYQQ